MIANGARHDDHEKSVLGVAKNKGFPGSQTATYTRKGSEKIHSVVRLGNATLVASSGGFHLGQGQALCMQDCDFHLRTMFI